jgi:phosphoglycerate dehydrogenase-like enzyme
MGKLLIASQMGGDYDRLLSRLTDVEVLAVPLENPAATAVDADILWASALGGWRADKTAARSAWPGRLRWAQVASAGIDAYPSWFFDDLRVAATRGNNAAPIAEYVMLALLAHAKSWDEIRIHAAADWRQARTLRKLEGATLTILGLGTIGSAIAERALAFGMRVKVFRRSTYATLDPRISVHDNVAAAVADADHVAVALASTAETRNIVDMSAFGVMKPGVNLVNIARGQVIDHAALRDALDSGIVASATLDVTDPEPLAPGDPLYSHPRVNITPHISWSNPENAEGVARKFVENIERHRAGLPILGEVDPARGY